MKKVLIDARLLSNKPTGISRYTKEIVHALTSHFGYDNVLVLVDTKYKYIGNYNILYTKLKPYNPIHYLLFSLFIYRQKLSVYYSTFYSGVYFKDTKTKHVLTVHDLMYLRITDYFSTLKIWNIFSKILFNFIVKLSLRSSDLIISVSNSTKNDVLEYFNAESIVIGEGVNYLDEKPQSTINIFEKLNITKEKYFLYVGNFRRQKNVNFLIKAFILSNANYQLVLVGDCKLVKKENASIIFAGILEDHEIQELYQNCLAFVMPSFYEGFGLPILEAFCSGARVLSSNQGALVEFENLGINYFSPFNINELISLIQNIDKIAKPTEIEIDLARKAYSWKYQTDKIINSIESLICRQ